MRISVIIPVYNAASTLHATVESVLAQDCPDVEIILVDDGSVDDSPLICDDICSSASSVKVIHKENGGVSSARNAGLSVASGDYVMFLDSDDMLRPGSLRLMGGYDSDLVLAGFRKVLDGKVTEVNVPRESAMYEGVEEMSGFLDDVIGEKDCFLLNSSCFKLYRRSIVEEYGLRFDEALRYGEDKMFVFRYLLYASSATTVPEVVYDYIIRSESLSSDVTSDSHVSQILMLLEQYTGVLTELQARYAGSVKLKALYHVDVVCRYVFRILTCFCRNTSEHCNPEVLALLYRYMGEDRKLSVFSVRPAQIPNVILYRFGNPRFSVRVYSFVSRILR